MTQLTKSWQEPATLQEIGTNRIVDAFHQLHAQYRASQKPRDRNLFAEIKGIARELEMRMIWANIEFQQQKPLTDQEMRQREEEKKITKARGRSFLSYYGSLAQQYEEIDGVIARQYRQTCRLYLQLLGSRAEL